MREGLRSGRLLLNPRRDGKDKVFPSKNVQNEMRGTGSDSNHEENLHLISSSVETEKEPLVLAIEKNRKEKYVEDGRDVALVENERKRRRVSGGEESEYGGALKKRVKEEEVLNFKVPIGGRVLRSMFVLKSGADEEGGKGESESVLVGKDTGSDGCEKKNVKVEKEGSDQLDGGLMMKLKKKRGRPPKEKKEEIDLRVGGLERNLKCKRHRPLGRPPKAGKEEADQSVGRSKKLKRGRGRPPKLEDSSGVLKAALDEKGKVARLRTGGKDLKLRDSVQVNLSTTSSYMEKRLNGKKLNVKRFSPAKKNKYGKDLETEDNKPLLRLKSKMVKASSVKEEASKGGEAKEEGKEVEPGRFAAKQLVREKITELLFSAGWTVQYRPRFGKSYNDAVYVSPDGKTHWSVTLAYRVLKQCYEAGDGESKTYKAGFIFVPILDEEFGILKRVVSEKREGKRKKKQKHKDGDKIGVIEKKRHKEKLSSIVSPGGKSVKRRMKGKYLIHEQDNSAGSSQEIMPILVRGHKLWQTQSKRRCALLVRNTEEGVDSDADGYIPYDGKRTVFAWMIDLGTVLLNGKVQYMNPRRTRVRLEGRITRDGIHCDCCSEVISISKFETHAGSNLCQPFQYTLLETGTSLLQCLLDSWNKQEESECKGFHFVDVDGEDPNDDTCGICGDGGDLICCDGCPSTFHQNCLDIKKFPSDDWHCVHCSCKFCGMVGGNTSQRHDNDGTAISALLTCRLCEEKFHQSCIQAKDAVNVDSSSPSFCGRKCQELFERLYMLHGVKHELEEGFSFTLIHRSDLGSDISPSEIPPDVEWNSKLAVAFFIMDECFLPVIDHRSGVNLIHNIVYNCGSNFTRLNYSGFYTVILERGDEIISAASIRIHGNQLAEMPFIGTRHMYRRQGMCRRLLSAIESVLCSLNVEKLVIPAISELRGTWTSIFGFKPLDISSEQKMWKMNMLVFPGIDMLQKPLLKHQFDKDNMVSTQGLMSTELMVAHNSDLRYSAGLDLNVSSEGTVAHTRDINQPAAVESGLQLCDGSLNDTSDITSETVYLPKCVTDMKYQVQFGPSYDNQEEDKTAVKLLDSVCDANGPTEEIKEYHVAASGSVIPTIDESTMELDSKSNHLCIPEVESKLFVVPHIGSEASDCRKPLVSASGMDTANVDCETKTDGSIVQHKLVSYYEISVCHSAKDFKTQPRDVACVDRLKVSGENIVLHNLGTTSQRSHDAKDIKQNGSQQLQDISASGMRTENVDCETKTDGSIVQHKLISYYETSVCHSTKDFKIQPRDVACVDRLKFSGENVALHNLGTTSHRSHDAKEIKHNGSQQLLDMGCILESDKRMLDTQEGKNSHAAVQCTSRAADKVCLASTEYSGSQIQPKTTNISCGTALLTLPSTHMVHPTSLSVHQREQTVLSGFLVECNISRSCQGNGLVAHEADVSAVVEGRCHFSSEASLNLTMKPNSQTCMSNGVCMATEVAFGSNEVTVDGVHEDKEASAMAE